MAKAFDTRESIWLPPLQLASSPHEALLIDVTFGTSLNVGCGLIRRHGKNTCYVNSTLRALFHCTPEFKRWIYEQIDEHIEVVTRNANESCDCSICAFGDIFRRQRNSSNSVAFEPKLIFG